MRSFLDFEKPIAELEGKIEEMRRISDTSDLKIAEEVAKLQSKVEKQLRATYGKLTPWQKVQVARHPNRPHFSDYVTDLITDFTPPSPSAGMRAIAASMMCSTASRSGGIRSAPKSGGTPSTDQVVACFS